VEIALPGGRRALTLRTFLGPETGAVVEVATYPVRGEQVLAARTVAGLLSHLRDTDDHELAEIPGWAGWVARVQPNQFVADATSRYELDLVLPMLQRPPINWVPFLLASAYELAVEFDFAVELGEAASLLEPDSYLDKFDTAVRQTDAALWRRLNRQQLRTFDAAALSKAWTQVIVEIDAAIEWVA
jgi:hypothetical protein